MTFDLAPLPFPKHALEPYMSLETVEYHYEKQHRGYLRELRRLIDGKPDAEQSLEELIHNRDLEVFNNAAQVWNHTFFWNCMQRNGGGEPRGEIAALIRETYGSFAHFKESFLTVGQRRFGSGYVWLVFDGRRLLCGSTHDAENPLAYKQTPLLTCDVWEHAYYLDHRDDRGKYLDVFLRHLVNWDFVAQQLKRAQQGAPAPRLVA
jgi:Fe-Mn family superoxide dismutase